MKQYSIKALSSTSGKLGFSGEDSDGYGDEEDDYGGEIQDVNSDLEENK